MTYASKTQLFMQLPKVVAATELTFPLQMCHVALEAIPGTTPLALSM